MSTLRERYARVQRERETESVYVGTARERWVAGNEGSKKTAFGRVSIERRLNIRRHHLCSIVCFLNGCLLKVG